MTGSKEFFPMLKKRTIMKREGKINDSRIGIINLVIKKRREIHLSTFLVLSE